MDFVKNFLDQLYIIGTSDEKFCLTSHFINRWFGVLQDLPYGLTAIWHAVDNTGL